MNYEELRDFIDNFDAAGMVDKPLVKALRAVVELSSDEILNQDTDLDYGFWDVDISNTDDVAREAFARGYACAIQKTIQAIEKELS